MRTRKNFRKRFMSSKGTNPPIRVRENIHLASFYQF